MKLKLPLKEIRRHQRDPAKVWRVMLGTSFKLASYANVPVDCPVNLGWTLNEGVHFLSRSPLYFCFHGIWEVSAQKRC